MLLTIKTYANGTKEIYEENLSRVIALPDWAGHLCIVQPGKDRESSLVNDCESDRSNQLVNPKSGQWQNTFEKIRAAYCVLCPSVIRTYLHRALTYPTVSLDRKSRRNQSSTRPGIPPHR
jgi:hypothetical protein